jgi:hypothetical protein
MKDISAALFAFKCLNFSSSVHSGNASILLALLNAFALIVTYARAMFAVKMTPLLQSFPALD